MSLLILTLGAFWYLRWRKKDGGNQVSEDDKGQSVPSALCPARTTLPYYTYYVSHSRSFVPFAWVANLRHTLSHRTLMIHRPIHPQWPAGKTHRLLWVLSLPSADLRTRVCTLISRSHYWVIEPAENSRNSVAVVVYLRPGAFGTWVLSFFSFRVPLSFRLISYSGLFHSTKQLLSNCYLSSSVSTLSLRLGRIDMGMDFI